MSGRLYWAELVPGDRVVSKGEVRYFVGEAIESLPTDPRGTVVAVEGIDALIRFDDLPDKVLSMGRYELRKLR